jgi:hypothetical protein
MTNKFKKEAYLKQFIGDNLCESVLPYILLNRYKEYVYRFTFGGGSEIDYRENGREIYGHYMDIVNDIRNQYVEDMKNIGTEENVRKTNGNMRKLNKLGMDVIDRRNKYIADIVYMYEEYKTTLGKCEYDPEYDDC